MIKLRGIDQRSLFVRLILIRGIREFHLNPHGNIRVPTHQEMLRIKGWLIITRNAVRDYVDFAALAHPWVMKRLNWFSKSSTVIIRKFTQKILRHFYN